VSLKPPIDPTSAFTTLTNLDTRVDDLEATAGIVAAATGVAATDTATIAAAVTALTAGQALTFPPRQTYVVKKTGATFQSVADLTADGVTIFGNGSKIQCDATSVTGTVAIRISGDDATITGLHFDANGVDQAAGIRISDATARPRIVDNTFEDCRLQILSATDTQIRGNQFFGLGYHILTNPDSSPARLSIVGNMFRGSGSTTLDRSAIDINTPTGGATDVSIVGNVISNYAFTTNANAGFGIALANVQRATVSGNEVSGCTRNGIHVEDASAAVNVSGNTVYNCQHAGIEVQNADAIAAPASVNVTGNTVYNCCTVADAYTLDLSKGGIQIGTNHGTPASLKQMSVVGNNVSGCGTGLNSAAGIYVHEARNAIISANTCRNNRSAGIYASTFVSSQGLGNRCYDDQGR
jgi:parallel beta-helix repeat protein